jgi:opacity protein-like surface antigen
MWVKCAVVFAGVVTVLPAQTWEVAPIGGYLRLSKKPLGSLNQTKKDDDTKLFGHQPAYGARLTLNTQGYYGVELGYLHSRARIDSRIVPAGGSDPVLETGTVHQNAIFLNGVAYFMPRGERFRPYATAGAALQLWSKPPLRDWSGGNSRNIGFNFGGGVKIKLMKSVLFRLDVRDILAGSPYGLDYAEAANMSPRSPGLYRQLEGTIGIGFTF